MTLSLVCIITNIGWIAFQNFLEVIILFAEINDYFFIIEFQSTSLAHDHGMVWSKNAPRFGISTNEKI